MSIITGRKLNVFFTKIKDVFADKSVYGNAVVSMGRKSGTKVGDMSFAFGKDVEASGGYSTAMGWETVASGEQAFTTGLRTKAYSYSRASGIDTNASGGSAWAEGRGSNAAGRFSSASGYFTHAANSASSAFGRYNRTMTSGGGYNSQVGDAFVIGNGYTSVEYSSRDSSATTLSNALRVTFDGNIYGTRAFKSSGADYAEYIKEWADGNPDNEDRIGYMVTIKNGLLYKANEGDYIVGITSGNPSVVGNADEDYYWKYERDVFNRITMEDVPETVQQTDEEDNPVFDEKTHNPIMIKTGKIIKNARMKLAENYDPSLQENYIERKDRKEWDYVGMVGILPVRDDGTCLPDHFCKCGQDGIATLATERGCDTFYVIERISDNVVSVELR